MIWLLMGLLLLAGPAWAQSNVTITNQLVTKVIDYQVIPGTPSLSAPNTCRLYTDGSSLFLSCGGGAYATVASGTPAPVGAQYVTLATDATLTSERVLTGTSNQIVVTDNGAGSTVVLSLPQSIATGSTVQFGGVLLGGVAFANLGTPANGSVRYCSDCDAVAATVCTSAGTKTGAMAFRTGGSWVCVGL